MSQESVETRLVIALPASLATAPIVEPTTNSELEHATFHVSIMDHEGIVRHPASRRTHTRRVHPRVRVHPHPLVPTACGTCPWHVHAQVLSSLEAQLTRNDSLLRDIN